MVDLHEYTLFCYDNFSLTYFIALYISISQLSCLTLLDYGLWLSEPVMVSQGGNTTPQELYSLWTSH